MRNDTSPAQHDTPSDWEHLGRLLANQPSRSLSAEREAALLSRVERETSAPRPLMQRPTFRRGILATGSALALTAAVWFTGVFDGDQPAVPAPSNAAPAASAPGHTRQTSRARKNPIRSAQEDIEIPPPPVRIAPDSVPAVPQHTIPPATSEPFTPGPGRR